MVGPGSRIAARFALLGFLDFVRLSQPYLTNLVPNLFALP